MDNKSVYNQLILIIIKMDIIYNEAPATWSTYASQQTQECEEELRLDLLTDAVDLLIPGMEWHDRFDHLSVTDMIALFFSAKRTQGEGIMALIFDPEEWREGHH